jgi:trimethylamine--corrinoid protein Co-methyltransferase
MISRVLDDSQIRRIHEASLQILAEVGVEVPHADMLARFADSGAAVDRQAQRVRIPRALVEKSLSQAGKRYTLYGRDLQRTAAFGQGRRN